ncbi:MAG TPA: sugar ABC transporter ATP-binding protein [Methylomirabilota bacterium]|nr:sugar ABC transporter ATP-binding protein [Methylomirabilota bacterium]
MTIGDIAFEARGVRKTFPGVIALDGVSLTLKSGSIHALLGENGAGKSTLIKVITGVHRPDSGELFIDGEPVAFSGARAARTHGIGVVHQERNLIPRFSIAENIALERFGAGMLRPVDRSEVEREARHWLGVLDFDVDPATPVSQLSVAKMQLVEIAKALSARSRVLLLDEPTASLTPHETVTLFGLLGKLRDDGVAIIFVSHKLEEVQEICDHVTILRDGRNACESRPMAGLGRQDIVRMMIGRSEQIADWPARSHDDSPVAMQLSGVATSLGHRDIALTVRKGEIVGLYGLVGAGRTELAKAIMGLFPITAGSLEVGGKPVRIASVADAIHRHGIGYVSEDRKSEGLILIHSVLDNAGMAVWRRLAAAAGILTDRAIRTAVEPFIRKLEVRTPSLHQTVGNLSGGNQQKISVAKWLAAGVKVLIVDEPSVGIDIKTKAYLHDLLRDLSDQGTAIVLITSDMPEMITVADRIVVMSAYRIRGEVRNTRDYAEMSHAIMDFIHDTDVDSDRRQPAA